MHDAGAIGDEDRDEARIDLVIAIEQALTIDAVRVRAADGRGQRFDRMQVSAEVLVDVLAQRRHRFLQTRAAVRFLPRGVQLTVDRGEQQHRQRADEHERVKRIVPNASPLERPHAHQVRRRDRGRDEIGDDNRHEAVQDDLQRDRPDRAAQRFNAVPPRRDGESDGDGAPDQRAGEERRFAAARDLADDEALDDQDDNRDEGCGAAHAERADRRAQRAEPRTEEDRDRQRRDTAERQRRHRVDRQRVHRRADRAAENREAETPRGASCHIWAGGANSILSATPWMS